MEDKRYKATTEFLFSQFPQYQNIGAGAYKPGLDGMSQLDNYTAHPHTHYPCIHIAGTNGKGSVCHMLAAVFQKAGYRTGLYTSPHLIDFRERIKVNGKMIDQKYVCDFTASLPVFADNWRPSFFEITTAMAFSFFAREKVDVAIIETGLGGRLDSTNIITPVLSIITSIGLEHCEHLGNTLELIAGEKAGIIKPGVPVVIGEYRPQTWPVFLESAKNNGSQISLAPEPEKVECVNKLGNPDKPCNWWQKMDLPGLCQRKNLSTVLTSLKYLEQSGIFPSLDSKKYKNAILSAASITGLHGRWECIGKSPRIIADTGHNAHGLSYLRSQLALENYRRLIMVFGVVVEKDLESIKALLPHDAYYIFTQASVERALPAATLFNRLKDIHLEGEIAQSVSSAMDLAISLAKEDDLIFVGGSNFVVGEALQWKKTRRIKN